MSPVELTTRIHVVFVASCFINTQLLAEMGRAKKKREERERKKKIERREKETFTRFQRPDPLPAPTNKTLIKASVICTKIEAHK